MTLSLSALRKRKHVVLIMNVQTKLWNNDVGVIHSNKREDITINNTSVLGKFTDKDKKKIQVIVGKKVAMKSSILW